jgi:hypothetical protein
MENGMGGYIAYVSAERAVFAGDSHPAALSVSDHAHACSVVHGAVSLTASSEERVALIALGQIEVLDKPSAL